jgi:hypothetical protein
MSILAANMKGAHPCYFEPFTLAPIFSNSQTSTWIFSAASFKCSEHFFFFLPDKRSVSGIYGKLPHWHWLLPVVMSNLIPLQNAHYSHYSTNACSPPAGHYKLLLSEVSYHLY